MNLDAPVAKISLAVLRPRRAQLRFVLWNVLATVIIVVAAYWLLRHHIDTLRSVRRVLGGNAYVMDYYAEYPLDSIRRNGVDAADLEWPWPTCRFQLLNHRLFSTIGAQPSVSGKSDRHLVPSHNTFPSGSANFISCAQGKFLGS